MRRERPHGVSRWSHTMNPTLRCSGQNNIHPIYGGKHLFPGKNTRARTEYTMYSQMASLRLS